MINKDFELLFERSFLKKTYEIVARAGILQNSLAQRIHEGSNKICLPTVWTVLLRRLP
jgi:hypothetical protein